MRGNGNNGLSEAGLRRLRQVLETHVQSKKIPGLVALVGRGEKNHVEAIATVRRGCRQGERATRCHVALTAPGDPEPTPEPVGNTAAGT